MELTTKGLLFDLDGTLLDSWPAILRVFTSWCEANDLDATQMLSLLPGRQSVYTVRDMLPNISDEELTVHVAALDRAELEDTDGVVALPGAFDLLSSLPADRWAIVTSCPVRLAEARLNAAGLPTPKSWITGDMLTHGKPHPEPYLRGAELIGMDPADIVVFEDAIAGVASARAAGMRVVGIRNRTPLDGAATVVDTPADIRVTVADDGLTVHTA